jgi:gas vesicle protein
MTRSDAPGTIFTFILGIAVGAVAALLLAPKSGEDLRADIAEGVSEGADQVRRKSEHKNSWTRQRTTYRMRSGPAKRSTAKRRPREYR